MRSCWFVLAIVSTLAACGGKPAPQNPQGSGSAEQPVGVVKDTRTEIERRRDAACEKLGARLTACAVEDARAELAAGKVSKAEFDANTAPEIQRENTAKFVTACKVPMSSRQVRVLEVCDREEAECGPLTDCLTHLQDKPAK